MSRALHPLAAAWARREESRLLAKELRREAVELRAMFAASRELREASERRRREGMRQEGPGGFVMVDRHPAGGGA